jgi:uncharacterized membrane protein
MRSSNGKWRDPTIVCDDEPKIHSMKRHRSQATTNLMWMVVYVVSVWLTYTICESTTRQQPVQSITESTR